jgi:hypothetical protein
MALRLAADVGSGRLMHDHRLGVAMNWPLFVALPLIAAGILLLVAVLG